MANYSKNMVLHLNYSKSKVEKTNSSRSKGVEDNCQRTWTTAARRRCIPGHTRGQGYDTHPP